MKILVLSDSHSAMRFMRSCVEKINPQAIVHLGDHYDDGETLKELYPHIPLHQVPGNCDRYRCPPWVHARLCYDVCGVRLFMTHGHNHGVKLTLSTLLRYARDMGAQAALFGHTHCAYCNQETDGLWVMNPGACGSYSGSVGLMEVQDKRIVDCKILRQEDLEEMV